MKSLLEVIKQRRSVREFTDAKVSTLDVQAVIEAGTWAPSEKNHQPWKFAVVEDESLGHLLAEKTVYSTVVSSCPVLIFVYLDTKSMHDEILDQQSVGAVMQNMMLAAELLDLGTVWLGQIRECRDEVNRELGIDARYDLAGVLAIGYPAHRNQKSHRKSVADFLL